MSAVIAILVIILGYIVTSIWSSSRRPKNYPPGPKWTPWIGNTYELRREARNLGGQHLVFEKWTRDYDSQIIGLKLGSENVVVVFSYPYVREVHTREVFEGRPDNFFLRLRTMGTRKGITCTDGSLWSEHRSFSVRHLRQVGYGRTQMEEQIKYELADLLSHIDSLKGRAVWPASFLAPSVINVLWSLTAGKRIDRHDKRLTRLLELLQKRSKAFDLCGGMLTQMPWLRFIMPERTGYNMICRLNSELHEFFMETINEHKKSYSEEKCENDLIYAYIREMNERQGTENNTFTDYQLTMTILDFFIAGSQTTSTTLDLSLMIMVIRTDIQEKIFAEISSRLHDEIPNFGHRTILPYTEAFLMEVQRFFHITPITGPRRALHDTTLGGYTIPKETTILIGLRSVLMDKDHWKDPETFEPERFLDENLTKVRQDDYFMPFGQGRRRCLGDSLARACLFTFFVGIIQRYQVKLVPGSEIPSTKLLPGITLSPQPYEIEFVRR